MAPWRRRTLEIRSVSPLFRGRDSVLIDKGLAAGERIVATALAAPAQGMALRTTPEAGGTLISRAPEGSPR